MEWYQIDTLYNTIERDKHMIAEKIRNPISIFKGCFIRSFLWGVRMQNAKKMFITRLKMKRGPLTKKKATLFKVNDCPVICHFHALLLCAVKFSAGHLSS